MPRQTMQAMWVVSRLTGAVGMDKVTAATTSDATRSWQAGERMPPMPLTFFMAMTSRAKQTALRKPQTRPHDRPCA